MNGWNILSIIMHACLVGILLAIVVGITVREPERRNEGQKDKELVNICNCKLLQTLFTLAATNHSE